MGTVPTSDRETRMMTGDVVTGRTDLSALLARRKEELGRSYRELEVACVDPEQPEAGSLWKRGTLENLLKGVAVKPPTYPQLAALAAGFELPLGRVQEAAGAQFFGIDTVWSDEDDVRALVHDYRGMSAEDQARLRAIMKAFRDAERG
ncbi:XRE family transcriptional regulator [Streptomyces longwoodensis]|uniref:XRE family transcriptional regulator n=1 Tax=Streptomyces longwoodensis TaxID=68231 RepID=UPI002DD8FA92|nr:XRE family transcriptional regulator [Streptomyces longwoodensis]WRY88774.1 XRE family transcriptional regulator [Streptomyces longwoodensis]